MPDERRDDEDHPTTGYLPPVIQRLGTLEELTLGGTAGPDDGVGGADAGLDASA